MTLNDIISLAAIIALGIIGIYYNHKFNEISKENFKSKRVK